MTLPVYTQLMTVARTLDGVADAVEKDGGDCMIVIVLKEEASQIRRLADEVAEEVQMVNSGIKASLPGWYAG